MFRAAKMKQILNAQITGTSLGYEESIFTFRLILDLQDGGAACVGCYALDTYSEEKKDRIGSAYGMDVISAILKVVGVRKWEELKGKYIRVQSEGIGTSITVIGNLMKNIWLDFETFEKDKNGLVFGNRVG